MPGVDSFIDTNILLYAVSTDPQEAGKAATAQNLLATANWAWSAQVAAEFIRASTAARRPAPLSLDEAERWIDIWLAFPLVAIDGPVVKEAIELARRFQIFYFDAQIISAAKLLGCSILYTEELNHGQNYAGVVANNPFQAIVP